MNRNTIIFILTVLIALICVGYAFSSKLENKFTLSPNDERLLIEKPVIPLGDECEWVQQIFSIITLYKKDCPNVAIQTSVAENTDGSVVETSDLNPSYHFTIKPFSKDETISPTEIVNKWFERLTPEQKRVCEIQNADIKLEFFPDGSPKHTSKPYMALHKTRLKIDIKPSVYNEIIDEHNGDDPGGGEGRDYMCGQEVGARWTEYPPYFEFDDRNPNKYLIIGAYAFESPSIDLSSLKF